MSIGIRTPCDRCGRIREVRPGRPAGLCRDCHYVEPHWPYAATPTTPDGSGGRLSAKPRATLPAPTRRGPA